MSVVLTYEQWYELRNLVLDAVHSKTLSKPSFGGFDDVIDLVSAYLKGSTASIDEAARKVAALCPGASPEAAAGRPWLLLEKS